MYFSDIPGREPPLQASSSIIPEYQYGIMPVSFRSVRKEPFTQPLLVSTVFVAISTVFLSN